MRIGTKIADTFRKDPNWTRLGRGATRGVRGVRAGAGRYFSNKIPIVQWIGGYSPKWLMGDIIAGQSVGMLLLPQALMYTAIGRVPIQQALLASWLPGFLYAIMGTSKHISVAPTSTSLIFVAQVIAGFPVKVPPGIVAGVLSLCIGLWSLLFGILNLGFIFDFVSVPMALGFLAGISNVVLTLQLPTLLGLTDITGTFMELMPEILHKLGETKIRSLGLGTAAIVILSIITFVDHRWGQKSAILKAFCASRNLFVLGTFTGVSYFLNRNLETPIWQTIGPIATTIPSPTLPFGDLFSNLLLPSLALFFSMTLEHVATAKAFGAQQSYSFNASQESVTIGIINIINSLFGGLPVSGGDVSRSSVLATSDSKSPLIGIFSSIIVLVSMYAFSGTLQYMPAPVVAAIIAVAIWDQMPPAALISSYWKISFVDFLHFLLAFNFSMFATPEIGIGLSFGFMVMYTLMRIMFPRPAAMVSVDLEKRYANDTPPWWGREDRIPSGMQVVALETDVCWLNAERVKRHVLATVYTFHSGITSSIPPLSRPWNLRRDKHIASLRRRAGVNSTDTFIPRFKTLVLDFTAVSFVDFCGITALQSIRAELVDYGGENTEFRFVGMCEGARETFGRAGWKLAGKDDDPEFVELEGEDGELVIGEMVRRDLVFWHLTHAIQFVDSMRPESFVYEEALDLKKG